MQTLGIDSSTMQQGSKMLNTNSKKTVYFDAFDKSMVMQHPTIPFYRRKMEVSLVNQFGSGGGSPATLTIKSKNIIGNFRLMGQFKKLSEDASNYVKLRKGAGAYNLLDNYTLLLDNKSTFMSYGKNSALLELGLISKNDKTGFEDMTLTSSTYTTGATENTFLKPVDFCIPLQTIVDGPLYMQTGSRQYIDLRKVDNNNITFNFQFNTVNTIFEVAGSSGSITNYNEPLNSLYLEYDEYIIDDKVLPPSFIKATSEGDGMMDNPSYNLQYVYGSYTNMTSGSSTTFNVNLNNFQCLCDGVIFWISKQTDDASGIVDPIEGVTAFELNNNGNVIERNTQFTTQKNRLRMKHWLGYFPDQEKIFIAQASESADVNDMDAYIDTKGMSGLQLTVDFTAPDSKNYRVNCIAVGRSKIVYQNKNIFFYS